jgi:YVTN family beta-propeller protein
VKRAYPIKAAKLIASSRPRALAVAAIATAVVTVGAGVAIAAQFVHAGPQGDGTAITPVGFRVTPAGAQENLGDLPLSMALSPDGSMLLVSNDGQGTQSLQVVDPATSHVTQTIDYPAPASLFYGLAFSPDGTTAYAAGGGDEEIHVYRVSGGSLTETTPISVPATSGGVNMFPAGIAVTGDGSHIVVADHLADEAGVVALGTGAVSSVAVGHAPESVVVDPTSSKAYITNQGADTVSVLDISDSAPAVVATIDVGTHPNAEVLSPSGQYLYVANGDSDQVSVVSTTTDSVVSTISLAAYDGANVGTNPTGLALSPDGRQLYVVDSGNNDIDIVDVAQGRVIGSIPTGWYPSAVVTENGNLYVSNAKGLGAAPNDGPGYPDPSVGGTGGINPAEYDGSMMVGTLSTIPIPTHPGQLARYTYDVAENDGFYRGRQNFNVLLRHSPIKHIIYVVQENRTYDQEFGSLGKGNGDPAINLFGDDSATNGRALERKFVTFDNFYADAEVSAQGWNWDVAANSDPYSEALWPANYSGRNAPYPSESGNPAIAPNGTQSTSYIWDELAANGISFRNYGFYVSPNSSGQEEAADPVLNASTDHSFWGFDLNCPDNPGTFTPRGSECVTPRIAAWLSEFNQYVANNDLSTLEFVRLPNDHTDGTVPGMPTALAYVADNDWALGQLVDAVSHSQYWKDTAMFVTEDDAQNGPDHVDAHRTLRAIWESIKGANSKMPAPVHGLYSRYVHDNG